MKRAAAIALLLAAFGISAGAAQAGNASNARLDAIATAISGHPTSVYCETDDVEWAAWEQRFNFRAAGFTFPDLDAGFNIAPFSLRTLYIAPTWCMALIGLSQGEDVGTYMAGEAMLVLTHESMHQRLNSLDEALVECNALKNLRDVAIERFGVPETVAEQYIVTVVKRVHGKKRRVQVVRTRSVPNPYLAGLLTDAGRWDSGLPAAYHGATC